MKKIILILFLAAFITSTAQTEYPKREFRGAWIATVANIDWPIDKNSSSGEQIRELVDMIESLDSAGINAILFQIRTECDAIYDSQIEPWSYWLTGKQGEAPAPFYDPLKFAIDEAHKRGIELHAWFNPYRCVKTVGAYEQAEDHVSVEHPEWILNFGNYKMLDPGNPEVKKYILDIVSDVLLRYDVDGIHFDDYFYPYSPKVSNEDSASFANYGQDFSNIDDWRRYNINSLMADIYDLIKEEKPYVKFGISPFGIVENKYAGTNGFESYNILYCDPINWIENRIVDYVNPQLYWELDHKAAPYAKLLPWWAEVSDSVHLYIGQYSSKMAAENYSGSKSELGDQLRLNRATPNVDGEVFFSAKSISQNYGSFKDSLKNNFYKYPALPPVMSWKDTSAPAPPENLSAVMDTNGVVNLSWNQDFKDSSDLNYFLIYKFPNENEVDLENPKYILDIIPGDIRKYRLENVDDYEEAVFILTALDRLKNESAPSNSAFVSEVRK